MWSIEAPFTLQATKSHRQIDPRHRIDRNCLTAARHSDNWRCCLMQIFLYEPVHYRLLGRFFDVGRPSFFHRADMSVRFCRRQIGQCEQRIRLQANCMADLTESLLFVRLSLMGITNTTSCAGGRHNMPTVLTFWPWKWCPSHVWRGLPLCQF